MAPPLHSPLLAARDGTCASCAAAMAADQRYCLECGQRRGDARLDPLVHARACTTASGDVASVTRPPAWADLPPAALALGRPRVAACAAAAVLAAGALIGAAAFPGPQDASAGRLYVAMNPRVAAATAASADDSGAGADGSSDTAGTEDPATTDLGADASVDTTASPSDGAAGTTSAPANDHGQSTTPSASTPAPTTPAPVKHVWLVALEGVDVKGGSTASAGGLASLREAGTVLTGYRSVARGSLANAIALVSGQRPTPQQSDNCPNYVAVLPGTIAESTGQVSGDGCVEPPQAVTLTDRLTGAGATWRVYAEDIGAGPPDETSCRHPQLGAGDPDSAPRLGDAYLTWRNPFVYFRSITESADCGSAVVGLDRLAPDLKTAHDTPAFSYVIPNACHDGSPTPCADGAPSGPDAGAAWLTPVVASIRSSPAYADGGLIVVTSPDGQRPADAVTSGGVPVGAVLFSPYVAAGATVATPYDHLSLLKTFARFFAVDPPGRAADPSVRALGAKVFANAPAPGGD